MAAENPTWGEERIGNELKLKLTIPVSPRTVGKYLRKDGPVRTPDPKQRWLTLLRNHAKFVVACDFFVVITAAFRTLYVFVVKEIGSRRILHYHVTAHPTAEWTLEQFREALPGDSSLPVFIHDRDRIFAEEVDRGLVNLGVRVLRTPVRAPQANLVCERLGGSLRRECLDFLIPFHDCHLQVTLREWTTHYNGEAAFGVRPRSARARVGVRAAQRATTQSACLGYRVVKRTVLAGLHHEYGLVKEAA
jgi:transposase InsO family protein